MKPIMVVITAMMLVGCASTETTRYEFDHKNVTEALTWILTHENYDRIAVEETEGGLIVDCR